VTDDPPSPRVAVSDRQDLPVEAEALAELAAATMRGEGAAGELALSFVSVEEMASLHERYLGEPGPTDVLAFPQGEDDLLGDVVVCPAYAQGQNPDLGAELRLLVVHGVLHLLGYDHEAEEERAEMWARQERYAGVRA